MGNDSTDHSGSKRMGKGRMIAIIAVAVIALVIIVQNFSTVKVQLFVWSFDIWLWLLLVVMFVLGMVFGGLARSGVRKLRGAPAKHN